MLYIQKPNHMHLPLQQKQFTDAQTCRMVFYATPTFGQCSTHTIDNKCKNDAKSSSFQVSASILGLRIQKNIIV